MRNKTDIRERVFRFYAKNRKNCDELYSLAEDEHIDQLYHDVTDEYTKYTILTKTSVVLLTANKYERNILHKKVSQYTPLPIQRIEIELSTAYQNVNKVFGYCFEWEGYFILNIHANVTGSYTIGGSADIIRWIILNEYLFPTAIVSFGICFGTKEFGNKLGDVIISKKVYPYFVGAKIRGKSFTVVDDNAFRVDNGLENKILDLSNNNKLNKFPTFKVYFSNYITGEAVVSSKTIRDKFVRTTTQEILAGEMEGYGLFKECNSNSFRIPCVLLKSICDWGTEKNFDANNQQIQSELMAAIAASGDTCPNEEDELKDLLGTLKDRLQAYAANCAFDVLSVMFQNRVFSSAFFDRIREWFTTYKGMATTCQSTRKALLGMMRTSNCGFSVPDAFVHRCIMLLDDDEWICCDEKCKCKKNKDECCIWPHKDAKIDIKKREAK